MIASFLRAMALGFLLALSSTAAQAQGNHTCPTAAAGDSSNKCADTAFVTTAIGVAVPTCSAHQWVHGPAVCSQPSFADISGSLASSQLPAPFTNGTASGSTSEFATVNGALVSGHCLQADASFNIVDAGTSCASSLPNSWVTPEQFGAVGNNVTDDTAAFQSLCASISAGNVHWVRMTAGKTYLVFPTTPSAGAKLCDIGAVNGLRWDFNGASFNTTYTGTALSSIFAIEGAQHVEINDLAGTSSITTSTTNGPAWVQSLCRTTCPAGFGVKGLWVNRANVNGGMIGVAIVRDQGVGAYSSDIHVTGTFQNVGYGMGNENDGVNEDFDIVTNNVGRSWIGYNTNNIRGKIYSTNWASGLEDVYFTCYGYSTTTDISHNSLNNIWIDYTSNETTSFGSAYFGIAHQQGDPTISNIPTSISGIHVNANIIVTGSPSVAFMTSVSETGNGNSQSPGDPGGNFDQITFSGRFQGTITGTAFGYFMSTAEPSSGWAGLSTGVLDFDNFTALTATQSLNIGVGAHVDFKQFNMPQAGRPVFDTGYNPNFVSYFNSLINGGGQNPTGTNGYTRSCVLVNFHTANADTVLPVASPSQNYRVNNITISGASGTLASATVGVFTASGGGGTVLAASQATTVTTGAANSSNNMQALTLVAGTNSTVSWNVTQLFVRVGTASTSAATAYVCIEFLPLGS